MPLDNATTAFIRDKYKHPLLVTQSLQDVLHRFQTLLPSVGTFMENDGSEHTMLQLKGVLAISYKSMTYSIPLELWFKVDFPASDPIVFVTPTPTMCITPSNVVDPNGGVDVKKLGWKASASNPYHALSALMLEMQRLFSASPPLFARTNKTHSSHTTATTAATTAIATPPHAGHPYASNGHSVHGGSQPYPVISSPNGHLMASAVLPSGTGSFAHSPAALPGAVPPDERRGKLHALQTRIMERLPAMQSTLRAELAVADQLKARQSKLTDTISALKQQTKSMDDALAVLTERVSFLEVALAEGKTNSDVSADELVIPASSVGIQQLGLVAEVRAIDDCFYAMERGLQDGAIDAQTYLRLIRNLARRQFMAKALLEKVISGAR